MRNSALILSCLLWITANAMAQQRQSHVPNYLLWSQEAWTGDDRPFTTARAEIDSAIAQKADLKNLVADYKAQLQGKGKIFDALAHFRWGYAQYKLGRRTPAKPGESVLGEKLINEVAQDLALTVQFKSPRSYQYARLRFLAGTIPSPNSGMKRLGWRLLKRNPNDTEVRLSLLNVCKGSTLPKEKTQALALWESVRKLQPNNIELLCTKGDIYASCYYSDGGHAPQDAAQAITLYRKYLAVLPAWSSHRRIVSTNITYLQWLQVHKPWLKRRSNT